MGWPRPGYPAKPKQMMIKKILIVTLLALPLAAGAKEMAWYAGGHVSYAVQKSYAPVVAKALDMFEADMQAVTGKAAYSKADAKVEIYQLDMTNNKEMKALDGYGVPYGKFITRKEAFWMGVRRGKLIVVGSDARGTAYGILELSRMAGVSPWIWWGDVQPERKQRLTIDDRFETLQSPSVEYRGIFINDEDWSSRPWSHNTADRRLKAGQMGPGYYHRLFELMLRLRANMLWPAMHEGTAPFFSVKGNREVADSFAIVVGSSHCEPMLRNNVSEWDEKKDGAFNFIANRTRVEDYWRTRVRETVGMDALYTLGMRGIHDGNMLGVKTAGEKLNGLQSVIKSQRAMLAKELGRNIRQVPQVFIPYKEVLEVYESGLNVPDDVALMWCDDNYGYLTRLSNEAEQRRIGGGGVYYHLSYWGRPHDYLWLTTTQPGLVCQQMQQAWAHHDRRVWVVNVHDPKVAAYQLSLFMDMAWNISSVRPEAVSRHLEAWLVQQFGSRAGQRLLKPMTAFYRLTGVRRPEFMAWSQVELDKKHFERGLSPVQDTEFSADEFGNELERYLADYEQVKRDVDAVERDLRPELKDAFFAAIKYPVYASAAMAVKQLQAQEARHIGRKEKFHRDEDALESAVRSWNAYQEIIRLTDEYNNRLAGGKWKGLMDMSPRNLPVFQAPVLPDQLTAEEIKKYNTYKPLPSKLETDGCVVNNACDFARASDGATLVDMLGHSMKAVALPKGGSLTYNFYAGDGNAVLRTAMIPTQPLDGGDLRYSVSIDGQEPVVYSLKEEYRSERWKTNVMRGQALRSENIRLSAGSHTLVITALDDNIIADQWMIDYDTDRMFYMFPVKAAY